MVSFREERPVWHKLAAGAVVLLLLGLVAWHFWPAGGSEEAGDPRQQARELSASKPKEAIAFAKDQLAGAKDAKSQIFWHEFLGDLYLKQKQKDNARTHYAWLAKKVPGEARYRKTLKSLGGAKKH